MQDKYVKSILNYTGGKYKLLPQIVPLFPNNIESFVDLFAGGVNVSLNIKAEKIICNDFNSHLIEMYKAMQIVDGDELHNYVLNKIQEFNLSKWNKEEYLDFRKYYNTHKQPLDLFVLACYCFSNSIRFNKQGGFNKPFGEREYNPNIQSRVHEFCNRIKNYEFLCDDYKQVNINKNSFVYMDPPYLITVADYCENGGWSEKDEVELLDYCDKLSGNGIKFALSNVFTNKGRSNELLIDWSKKYNIHYLKNDYSLSSANTKNRDKNSTQEVLVVNY